MSAKYREFTLLARPENIHYSNDLRTTYFVPTGRMIVFCMSNEDPRVVIGEFIIMEDVLAKPTKNNIPTRTDAKYIWLVIWNFSGLSFDNIPSQIVRI
jgi:hypothetical protein